MFSQKMLVVLFCLFVIIIFVGLTSAKIGFSNPQQPSVIKLKSVDKSESKFFLWEFVASLFQSKKTQASVKVLPLVQENQDFQGASVVENLVKTNTDPLGELTPYKEPSSNVISKSSKTFLSKKSSPKEISSNDDNREDEIITRNGTKYIIRDGKEYLLSSKETTSDYYIEFDPALPSSVCEAEVIDITVKGYGSYSPTLGELALCATQQYLNIGWCVRLMEDDSTSGDDELRYLCGTSRAYVSVDYPHCTHFYFQADFQAVDLSAEIIPDPGDSGEFYAKIEDNGYNDGEVQQMSTPTYDVYGYVNGECECISGACCDLAGGRPYDFKPSGGQPTGASDYYFCSGTNSPTGTNYVKLRNWYCNGVDSLPHYTDTTADTCGYCEYCTDNDPTCNYYSQGTSCGSGMICDSSGNCVTICDCSSGVCCDGCYYRPSNYVCNSEYAIDYGCPNGEGTSYPGADVFKRIKQRYCSGSLSSCSGSISDWLSWNVYDYCSSDEYCADDDSSCNGCGYHTTYGCFDNDVYWYDHCFNLEDKKEECGEDENTGNPYCCLNNVCQDVLDRGCRMGSCYEEIVLRVVAYCGANGCLNGQCVESIACYSNSDCGTDGWVGSPICSSNDVYQNWRTYTCNNAGTPSSYCSYNDVSQKKQECGDDAYSSNYCYDNDVYRDFIDRGCTGGSCFETTTRQKVQECGANGCLNGQCVADCDCSSGVCCDGCYYRPSNYVCNSEYAIDYGCPNGEGTSYPGADVFKRIKQRYCSGSLSSCSGSISDWLSWNVYDYCSSDEYCADDDSSCNGCGYHTTYGCFDNDVYWYDHCFNLEDKKEECGSTPCIQKVCAGEFFTDALSSGWNDIIFPGVPLNNSIENVLASIKGKYNNVWAYVDGEWLSYSPTVLPLMNTLLYIEEDMTISIEMKQAATLSFLYFPGNLSEVNYWCELGCYSQSVYDVCMRQYSLEIEGEIIQGTCDFFATQYPILGIKECSVFDCP